MDKCLICSNTIELTLLNIFDRRLTICNDCLNSFSLRNEKYYLNNIEIRILYYYNDFFKSILYQYKSCKDYALKECFLNQYKDKIRKYYKGYYILPVPSTKESDILRRFNHVEEIAKIINLPIVKCAYKKINWKQSSKNKKERGKVLSVIDINLEKIENIDKILILDDVATTFSTIKTIIEKLPKEKKIKVLVLASNFKF